MSNPTISFRLSQHQIAAGLNIVRQLEPKYKFSSPSKLVKTIYFDYIAKMTLGKGDVIHQHLLDEVDDYFASQNIISNKFTTFQNFIDNNNEESSNNDKDPLIEDCSNNSESIKSTVENWYPPEDWDV